jgi:RNA polymerase sigma-B factor
MAILTARERRILRLRFEHYLTQEEIGRHVGVSQMQVSRILRQSITRLRTYTAHHAAATHGKQATPADP